MYLPEDKLTRVVDKGTVQYVKLAETMEAAEYDVIVDEAPSGPNQKAKVMQVLMPMMQPLFEGGIIGAEEIADMLPYMDLPAAVADKLANAIRQRAQTASQPNPQQQALEQQAAEADIANKHADTENKQAQAFKAVTHAHMEHAQAGAEFLAASSAAQQPQSEPTPQDASAMPPPAGPAPGPQ
jgi:hypothetical protein